MGWGKEMGGRKLTKGAIKGVGGPGRDWGGLILGRGLGLRLGKTKAGGLRTAEDEEDGIGGRETVDEGRGGGGGGGGAGAG